MADVVVAAVADALSDRNRRWKPEEASTARPHQIWTHKHHHCGTKAAGKQLRQLRLHLRLRPGRQSPQRRVFRGRGAGAKRLRAAGATAAMASGAAVVRVASAGLVASDAHRPAVTGAVFLPVGPADRCRLRRRQLSAHRARPSSSESAVVGHESALECAAPPPFARGKACADALALALASPAPHLLLSASHVRIGSGHGRGGGGLGCAVGSGSGSVAAFLANLELDCRTAADPAAACRTPVPGCCGALDR